MSAVSKIDSFHYVKKMAKVFEDNEKRFVFIRSQILSFEECMEDGPKKSQTIKSLITWAFKEFVKIENFKSDPRMLVLWKLMGKYSVNIGMDGVLENIFRLGFFKSCPDFYLMWADYLGLNENKENFVKVVQICEDNCQLSSYECQELFRPLLQKYFGDYNEGKTLDVIKMLADEPEDVRPDLTLFQRKGCAPSTSSIPQANVIAQEYSIYKDEINDKIASVEKTGSKGIMGGEDMKMKKRLSSYYPEDDITIAGSHGKFSSDMFTSTPRRSVMPNDFDPMLEDLPQQKFVDPVIKEDKPVGVGLFGNNVLAATDNKVIIGGGDMKMKKRVSYYPALDDITIAGSHGKFSSDMFTSTPRRSVMPNDFDPMFEDLTQRNQFFNDFVDSVIKEDKHEEVGLFGNNLATIGSKGIIRGGDMKMKKRLSFADDNQKGVESHKNTNPMADAVERMKKAKSNTNELIRTLPQLKIGSTIHEESEEKKITFESESPEFPSPFRKKKRDYIKK